VKPERTRGTVEGLQFVFDFILTNRLIAHSTWLSRAVRAPHAVADFSRQLPLRNALMRKSREPLLLVRHTTTAEP
jgi:hypothetical protein